MWECQFWLKREKLEKDLEEAIFSSENNCVRTLIENNKFYIWKYKSTMKIWLFATTLQES